MSFVKLLFFMLESHFFFQISRSVIVKNQRRSQNIKYIISHLRFHEVLRIQLYRSIYASLGFFEYFIFQIVHRFHAIFLAANFTRLKVWLDRILESLQTKIC